MQLNDPNFRCKNCVYWSHIYVHPWSFGVPDSLKMSKDGFACLLALDKEFIESFNEGTGVSYEEDRRVDVTLGLNDGFGCECLTEKDKYNLVIKLEKKNE